MEDNLQEMAIRKEKELLKNKINNLKAQTFDMIRQQESLVVQNNQIQETKIKLVQEIQKLESSLI